MEISGGSRLGPYEVISILGSGGMSKVYRARDTKLGREVAIKVLPDDFTQDPDRLERFQREAQLLASLNHPNIAAIYGLERSGDVRFLVLELVPGLTLEQRMAEGRIEAPEALKVFRQIAGALESAHQNGIIHRDLKPANVKITPDGTVKLLDFGLAKDLAPETETEATGATATYHGISDGLILGTPAYMSPEQARGKSLDKRTDIWSFGCCLFEALAGRHPFEGETSSDTVAAILSKEPDWPLLEGTSPRSVQVLLHRCLKKDANLRLHDIADARIEIDDASAAGPQEVQQAIGAEVPRRSALPWALAGMMMLVAMGIAIWSVIREGPSVSNPLRRFVITLPTTAPVSLAAGPAFALSPDGERAAYVSTRGGQSQIYFRALDQLRAVPVPETGKGTGPFFSWDNQFLGFFSGGKLKKLPLVGGAVQTLCDSPNPRGASWGPDGQIVFSPLTVSGLSIVSSDGGTPRVLTELDPEGETRSHRWPQILPGGKWVLYTAWLGEQFQIEGVSLETGERKTVMEDGFFARYAPTGHLVFARNATLLAAPFDLARFEVIGPPVPLIDDLETDPLSGAAFYSLANDGTLIYVPTGNESTAPEGTANLLWVDSQGNARPIIEPRPGIHLPRLSPDGKRLLMTVSESDDRDKSDIWLAEYERGTMTRLTFEGTNGAAIWMPDGNEIIFSSDRGGTFGIYRKPSDGSLPAEPWLESPLPRFPLSWSPDGQVLAFAEMDPTTGLDIWLASTESGESPRPLLNTSFNEGGAAFSPNGRWIAYVSDETGREEVYVRALPGPAGKWQISSGGGNEPRWARNGRQIYYRNQDWMMSVTLASEEPFRAGKPRPVFEGDYDDAGALYPNYDITPDGRQFVMVRSERETVATQLNVVLNWFAELERRAPVGGN